MALLTLRLTQSDYSRASAFVIGRLRRHGELPTSLKPLLLLAYLLYAIPLFLIVVAPDNQDDSTRMILKGAVLALLVVPALLFVGVSRLRKADARALHSLAPPADETVTVEATAKELSVKTETMSAAFPWSAVAVFVLGPEFAVILAPRTVPLPIPAAGSDSPENYFTFLRHAQQYKSASVA